MLQRKSHWGSLSIDARRVSAKQFLTDLRRLYRELPGKDRKAVQVVLLRIIRERLRSEQKINITERSTTD